MENRLKNLFQKTDCKNTAKRGVTIEEIINENYTIEKISFITKNASLEELKPLLPKDVHQAYEIPHILRRAFIPFMGFSLINLKYVDTLAAYLNGKKVLEVMSGNGLLSMLLKEKGVDIIATDIAPGEENSYDIKKVFNPDIEKIDAISAIKKYGKDIDYIIMSWPPYNNPIATEVMQTIKSVNNDIKVIYIGEGPGGCTADDTFFEQVDLLQIEEFTPIQHSYSSWFGIHDLPFIVTNK